MKIKVFILLVFIAMIPLDATSVKKLSAMQNGSREIAFPASKNEKISVQDMREGIQIYLHAALYRGVYLDVPPAELLMVDPQGRRLGKDPRNNEEFQEIPKGGYERIGLRNDETGEPGHTTIDLQIMHPLVGDYQLYVIGTDTGAYSLEISVYDPNLNPSGKRFKDIDITAGEIHKYQIISTK